MIYAYARVSTDRQENSAEAQSARLLAYCEQSGLPFGGLYVDEDQSAYQIPLSRRREGKRLCDALSPGDTLVFTKIDRVFRSMRDQCNTLANWAEQGLKVVILDMPIQYDDPFGRAMLESMGSHAQLESALKGQRIREVNAYLKQNNLPYGGCRPLGWLVVNKRYVPCESERELGRRVVAMKQAGASYQEIALALCKEGVRKPRRRKGSAGWYHVTDIQLLHRAAVAGFPTIPPRVSPTDWHAWMQRAKESGAHQQGPAA